MPDVKSVVALTNVNVDKMSRHDLLKWVNSTVNGQYKKVEELCSGVAYCQMVEMLYPKSIGLKKIKTSAKMDLDYIHNLKLLQNAFTRLKFEKSIPIDRLSKGKMQDNLEFLQWFKKFYDSQCGSAGIVPSLPLGDKENSLQSNEITSIAKKTASYKALNKEKEIIPKEAHNSEEKNSNLLVLEKEHEELTTLSEGIINETQFYYLKLTKIEECLNKAIAMNENVDWCNKVLQILYATKDGETSSFSEKN